jgi:hypothetical protein
MIALPLPCESAPGSAETGGSSCSSCCMFHSVHMRMIAANALTATNALTAAILPTPISQPFIAAPAFPVLPQPRERQRYSLVRVYRLLGAGASVGWSRQTEGSRAVAGCYRTKSTTTRIPVSTISTLTMMMVMTRKVRLPVEKSGMVPGGGGPRRGSPGFRFSVLSPCARQPRWSSGGVQCDPIAHHQPICREARDAEMAPATLPDGGAAVRHRQYVIVRCGAAS